jgi:hypothetical protein
MKVHAKSKYLNYMTVSEMCNNYTHALSNFISLSCNFKLLSQMIWSFFSDYMQWCLLRWSAFFKGRSHPAFQTVSVSTSHQPLTETETDSDTLNMNSIFAWADQLRIIYQSFPFCLLFSILKVFSLYFLLLTLGCQNSMQSAEDWDFNSPLTTLHVTAWWLYWSFGFLRIPPCDYSHPSVPNGQFQLSDRSSNTGVRRSDHGTLGNTVLHTFLMGKTGTPWQ